MRLVNVLHNKCQVAAICFHERGGIVCKNSHHNADTPDVAVRGHTRVHKNSVLGQIKCPTDAIDGIVEFPLPKVPCERSNRATRLHTTYRAEFRLGDALTGLEKLKDLSSNIASFVALPPNSE